MSYVDGETVTSGEGHYRCGKGGSVMLVASGSSNPQLSQPSSQQRCGDYTTALPVCDVDVTSEGVRALSPSHTNLALPLLPPNTSRQTVTLVLPASECPGACKTLTLTNRYMYH
ncbi:hypothetical protein E2C01_098402 [Portunus trituberculatus]|uniref:Uncharacterized protein n=1 Tax=Portunus trituberculatus TaxID=210409 RepID=A0A5B7KC04_PORTR|nr:hypothetical protein [Portunus trituberculatus]